MLEQAVPAPSGGGSVHVRAADGTEYLDAIGGIGCAPLGHAHPLWVAAIHRQLGRLAASANSFHTAPQQQLAARLIDLFPIPDARVFFGTTGTEATEAAIKLAVRATGRNRIIAFERAFHGRTLGALSLTANPAYRAPYISCPGEQVDAPAFVHSRVTRLPFGDLDAVARAFAEHGSEVAAVIVEPIQGEGGVYPATREFLLGLRKLCTDNGALLGADEIQTGVGRTGNWAAWTTIVGDDPADQPDILWLAKALGGGFPVAACLARASCAEAMTRGTHGTTFGGNPLACSAGLATLRIIEEEGLLARAAAQLPTLQKIAEQRPIARVTEIRGAGAMLGIQIDQPKDKSAGAIGTRLMHEHHILVTVCGGHTVRLLFPYGAGEAELRQVWDALATCLETT